MAFPQASENNELIDLQILERVFEGLQEIVAVICQAKGSDGRFKKPFVAMVPGDQDLREYITRRKDVTYPFVGLTLATIGPHQSINQFAALRDLGGVMRSNGLRFDRLHGQRVIGTVQVRYRCQSQPDLLVFIKNWMLRYTQASFVIEDELLRVPVFVALDRNLTIPPMRTDLDNQTARDFQMDAQFTFITWLVEAEPTTPLQEIIINFKSLNAQKQPVASETIVVNNPNPPQSQAVD